MVLTQNGLNRNEYRWKSAASNRARSNLAAKGAILFHRWGICMITADSPDLRGLFIAEPVDAPRTWTDAYLVRFTGVLPRPTDTRPLCPFLSEIESTRLNFLKLSPVAGFLSAICYFYLFTFSTRYFQKSNRRAFNFAKFSFHAQF